jgi:hypothetical protein
MLKRIITLLFTAFSCFCFAAISVEAKLEFSCNESDPALFIDLRNVGDELATDISITPMELKLSNEPIFYLETLRVDDYCFEKITLTNEQRNNIITGYSCCAYPFLFNYKDRFGNTYSSTLLATCKTKHQTNLNNELNLELSSACVMSDSITGELAITIIYDYKKAIEAGAEALRLSFYLPEKITTDELSQSQNVMVPLDESGFCEFNTTLNSDIKNMSGFVLYSVTSQFVDNVGNSISTPVGLIESIQINAPLDTNTFPQNLNYYIFIPITLIVFAVFILKFLKPDIIKPIPERMLCAIEWLTVVGITIYLGILLQIPLALKGYTCMGGDLPAHHYLVEQMCRTGSPVSWADGWWCGFPMFHYYFPLPYTCIALLSNVFSHNVAFNIGVCLGMLLLPLSVYLSTRLSRMPRPLPILAVVFVVPLLLDNTHNMWGVNAYSTLAGMIANSWSFCLLLPALASICRDTQDNKFRIRTPLLIAAVALSHFFTSIVLALIVGVFWIIACVYSYKTKSTHYRIALIEGCLAILLVSWWLIPLAMSGEWAVAFGSQWEISFFKQLPNIVRYFFLPAILLALSVKIFTKEKIGLQFWGWFVVFILLFLISLLLLLENALLLLLQCFKACHHVRTLCNFFFVLLSVCLHSFQ